MDLRYREVLVLTHLRHAFSHQSELEKVQGQGGKEDVRTDRRKGAEEKGRRGEQTTKPVHASLNTGEKQQVSLNGCRVESMGGKCKEGEKPKNTNC